VLASASATAAEIVKPRLLDSIEAGYPAGAHGDAQVELQVLIGEDGRVTELTVRTGVEPFASAARDAVAKWIFSPATRGCIELHRVSFSVSVSPVAENANANVFEGEA